MAKSVFVSVASGYSGEAGAFVNTIGAATSSTAVSSVSVSPVLEVGEHENTVIAINPRITRFFIVFILGFTGFLFKVRYIEH